MIEADIEAAKKDKEEREKMGKEFDDVFSKISKFGEENFNLLVFYEFAIDDCRIPLFIICISFVMTVS